MIPGNFLRDNSEFAKKEVVDIKVLDQFHDKNWRMWNLYWFIDEDGKEQHFVPNDMQVRFYKEMWYLNVILKSRQHGFTTGIDIWMLDECVFYSNLTAGIIAHSLDDVKKIFRTKVKYPYDHLPEEIRLRNPANNDSAQELVFANNSSIAVATSMRSGTSQLLHVSEFGKIASRYPDKADEVVSGSFNTVHPGNYIFVESTAEGRSGAFFDMCKRAQDMLRMRRPLTRLDFKFHFYPWWINKKNRLSQEEAETVVFERKHLDYFRRTEREIGCALDLQQRAWWLKKKQLNGSMMSREHPSTPKESFEASIKGAYFADEMATVREQGRITRVPHEKNLGVDTWWDIGVRDKTAIWFTQTIGRECRCIYYHETVGKGLIWHLGLLDTLRRERGFHYRNHMGPHDLNVREWGTEKTRWETARNMGFRFGIGPMLDFEEQKEAARGFIPICIFDEENCASGIEHLENFRAEWNEHLGQYMTTYLHDEHSHGASAFMLLAVTFTKVNMGRPRAQSVQKKSFAT